MSALIQKVNLPEATRGDWTVRKVTVSEDAAKFEAVRAVVTGSGRMVPAGQYTQLLSATHGLVMSDTPDEMRDHSEAVRRATGHVLINGLGLGMVLAAVLRKPEVTKVTVVEIDADVIAMVGPHYASDPRVEIVHASAFDYRPPKGVRYGAVWHDIWPGISGSNVLQMTKLKRKYGRRSDWQGCWAEYQCKRRRGSRL